MKNIKLLVLMSLMAVLCLPARATEVYTVSSVSGTVNALTPAGKSIPLRVGDAVPALNEVQTGDESTATLISANVEVSIEAKSRLRSEARGSLRLEEGEILAKLKKLPARSIFEVHTPVATATVRGTTLQAIHRDGKSVIVVVEGIVEVVSVDKKGEPRKDIQTLTIGQRALIDETGFLKWNPDEIIADGTEKNADIAGIKVEAVEKAYYIVPSCRVADNISTCPKDEGEDEKP